LRPRADIVAKQSWRMSIAGRGGGDPPPEDGVESMTRTHRNLDALTRWFSAPTTLAAAGYRTSAPLSFVGLRPLVSLGSRMRRAPARVAAACAAWHERARQRSALMELSDYMLCDIGVSRAAAIDEAEKPFWRS
jgi:uncharacterized protein YjiS (DUF1127 family)